MAVENISKFIEIRHISTAIICTNDVGYFILATALLRWGEGDPSQKCQGQKYTEYTKSHNKTH